MKKAVGGHVFLVPGILKGGRTKQRHDMIWVSPPKNCKYMQIPHLYIFIYVYNIFFLPCKWAEGQKTCSTASDWICPRGSLEVCVALAAIHIYWLFEEPIVAEKKGFDFSSLGQNPP